MNEQNAKLLKVKKSCKTAKNITLFSTIFISIVTAISLVGGVLARVYNDAINDNLINATEYGLRPNGNTLGIHGLLKIDIRVDGLFAAQEYAMVIAITCFFTAFIGIMLIIIFRLLYKTFAGIEKSDSPFSENVLGSLKKVFIILTLMVVLFVGVGAGVISGLCLWCVYTIMDYGMALQMEVDDTI